MGRAISALREDEGTDQQHLAAAYEPPQVEALAALEQAKDLIDQQAAKANQALDQQRKDAIRAVYQKILESQKKIDADTVGGRSGAAVAGRAAWASRRDLAR